MARAFGRDWFEQARRPYHETLYTYLQLTDVERVDALLRDGERLREAFRMNWAMANPEALRDEQARYRDTLARDPHAPAPEIDPAPLIADAAALFAGRATFAKRLGARGGVA